MRKVGIVIQRIVIFSTAAERHKRNDIWILNLQEINSDFNSKMLNFNMGFTSY